MKNPECRHISPQLNDLLMDSFAVSIHLTLYISWNIYAVTWVNICSRLSLWLTVQAPRLDVNCLTCHRMAYEFNVLKVELVIGSDCQSVMVKSPQWFWQLMPITNCPPILQYILWAQMPTGLHQSSWSGSEWSGPLLGVEALIGKSTIYCVTANGQAWPQQRKSEKSKYMQSEKGSPKLTEALCEHSPSVRGLGLLPPL